MNQHKDWRNAVVSMTAYEFNKNMQDAYNVGKFGEVEVSLDDLLYGEHNLPSIGEVESWQPQQPATPQADWSHAPAWAMWWAVDADDNVAWYQSKPFCIGGGWTNTGGLCKGYDTMLPYHLPIGIDWRTTLQARPTDTEANDA